MYPAVGDTSKDTPFIYIFDNMDKILGYYFVSNYDQVHWHNDPILKVDDKKQKNTEVPCTKVYMYFILNISIIKKKKNHLHFFGNFL